MHRSIETQLKIVRQALKIVRQARHKEFLHKVKSRHYLQEMMSRCQTILATAMFPNLTVLMNTKPVLVKLTNYWPPGTVAIVGDSIENGNGEKQLSMSNRIVNVFYFSRTRIRYISQSSRKIRILNFTC